MPLAVDLFCGCGGLSLGLERAGFRVIAAIDHDELATNTYAMNHRRTDVLKKDIRKVSAKAFMKFANLRPASLGLLAGCPPCQGFSSVRTKNGRRRPRDKRNDLLLDFLRFVRVLKPKAILLENVPGLAKTGLFKSFCRQLGDLGYAVNFEVLNAADYGIPQRRRRLLLVASRTHFFPLTASQAPDRTVRDAISDLPHPKRSRDKLHAYVANHTKSVRTLIGKVPRNGGSRASLPAKMRLACHSRLDGFKDVYGRMSWDSVAPTITSGCINPSKGRFLHPTQARAITLREAALLQGFPRKYKFSMDRGRYPVAAMIGNAIPPEFVRHHAALLKKTLPGSA